jgi:hypothetical protein
MSWSRNVSAVAVEATGNAADAADVAADTAVADIAVATAAAAVAEAVIASSPPR